MRGKTGSVAVIALTLIGGSISGGAIATEPQEVVGDSPEPLRVVIRPENNYPENVRLLPQSPYAQRRRNSRFNHMGKMKAGSYGYAGDERAARMRIATPDHFRAIVPVPVAETGLGGMEPAAGGLIAGSGVAVDMDIATVESDIPIQKETAAATTAETKADDAKNIKIIAAEVTGEHISPPVSLLTAKDLHEEAEEYVREESSANGDADGKDTALPNIEALLEDNGKRDDDYIPTLSEMEGMGQEHILTPLEELAPASGIATMKPVDNKGLLALPGFDMPEKEVQEVPEETVEKVEEAVGEAAETVEDIVGDVTGGTVEEEIGDAVEEAVEDAVEDAVEEAVGNASDPGEITEDNVMSATEILNLLQSQQETAEDKPTPASTTAGIASSDNNNGETNPASEQIAKDLKEISHEVAADNNNNEKTTTEMATVEETPQEQPQEQPEENSGSESNAAQSGEGEDNADDTIQKAEVIPVLSGDEEILESIAKNIKAQPQATGRVAEPIDVYHVKPSQTALADETEVKTHESLGISIEVKTPPPNVGYQLEQAYEALIGGHPEVAVEIYRDVLSIDPQNTLALFGMATTYHRIGELDRAREFYGRLLALNPRHQEAIGNYMSLLAEESPKSALEKLTELEKSNPDYSPVVAQLAAIYEKMGNVDMAVKKIMRAVELAPENLSYRYNYAVLLDKAQRWNEAAEVYKQLIAASERGLHIPGDVKMIQERLIFIVSNNTM